MLVGVLVTLANRSDITSLQDIEGQRVSAIAPNGYGGFLMQWRELFRVGMSVLTHPSQVGVALLWSPSSGLILVASSSSSSRAISVSHFM